MTKAIFGDLVPNTYSQRPEVTEGDTYDGLDLIIKNNQQVTSPRVIEKLSWPLPGIVLRCPDESEYVEKVDGVEGFIEKGSSSKFYKYRIYIDVIHSHLFELIKDPKDPSGKKILTDNLSIDKICVFPIFISQNSQIPPASPGSTVWCTFLDKENLDGPIYLGPVDMKNSAPVNMGAVPQSSNNLVGSAAGGDVFGGKSYKNDAGQISYPTITGSWTGELPINGFTATQTTVDQLIMLAKLQIGKQEDPMGSNGGQKIDFFNGGRKEIWSSAALAWLFRTLKAPLPGDKIPSPTPGLSPPETPPGTIARASIQDAGWNKLHSISVIENYFRQLNAFFSEPKPADMIIYKTQTSSDQSDSNKHIGLVTEVDGDTLKTVEFDWDGTVSETYQDWKNGFMIRPDGSRYKSKYSIVGFARRPLPYSGAPDGKLIEAPVNSIAGTNFVQGANHPYYRTATKGVIDPEPVEMVFVDQPARILFPKKYIAALEAMRSAYARENAGNVLQIVSGYRDVEQQTQLYNAYLARNKAPPQVAPPGWSFHNNGLAVDIFMGLSAPRVGFSEQYTLFASQNSVKKDDVFRRVAEGQFGPVARWLVQNCGRFGFYWDGWSYKELWHYQLNPDAARQAGLIVS